MAPPCGLRFFGKSLKSDELNRVSGLKLTNRPSVVRAINYRQSERGRQQLAGTVIIAVCRKMSLKCVCWVCWGEPGVDPRGETVFNGTRAV